MLLVAGEFLLAGEELVDLHRLAVDPRSHVALTGQILEQCLVLALASTDDRSEHLEPRSLRQFKHPVDDLLGGLAL